MTYSKPVRELTIDNWPYGRKQVQAVFTIETVKNKEGHPVKERAVRVTQNPKNGVLNKPKKMTYTYKVLFVTGEDNKTYILQLTEYGSLSVMQSNFKYQQETIYNDDPRFTGLLSMFDGV